MKTHKYKGYEYVKAKWGFYIKLTDGNWAGFHKYCGLRKTIDWLNHDTLIEGTLCITTTEQLKEYLATMREHNYFVRTRDKIYQGRDDFVILKDQELYIKHFQDHIVTIADTIEELCDEFVFIKGNSKNVFPPITYNKQKDIKFFDEIYGAIWTDIGLIYVARMNEKGELELL